MALKHMIRFVFLLFFPAFVFAQDNWQEFDAMCSHSESILNCELRSTSNNDAWRVSSRTHPSYCSGVGTIYVCELHIIDEVCSDHQLWDQSSFSCIDSCQHGQIPNQGADGCSCPDGTILTNILDVNGASQECIAPPQDCDDPLGTVNGVPVCESDDSCPDGHQSGFVNGDQVCYPPLDEDQCPDGSFHGTINGNTQCWDEDPNIDDSGGSDNSENEGDNTDSDGESGTNTDGSSDSNNESGFDDSKIVSELQQANDTLDSIDDTLSDIDSSLKGEGSSSPDIEISPSRVKSFYESEYPNGFAGVWDSKLVYLKQTPLFSFADQFVTSFGTGSTPLWSFCIDLGALGNYGCKDLSVPDYVWSFVALCIIITAAFLSRALIFGG